MSFDELDSLVKDAKNILVIQAENPDGDSLATSLALEEILSEIDKQVIMYCPVQIPRYLRFMSGWDRVVDELPKNFDISIIVDTSSATLLERVFTPENTAKLRAKPTVVIDHHTSEIDMPFSVVEVVNQASAATGELVYDIAKSLSWPLNKTSLEFISQSIMFDTLGLMSEQTSAHTFEVVTEIVKAGVSLAELEERRRQTMKKSVELVRYKAELLKRIDYSDSGVASIIIPWEEIEQYSDQYNPSMLVIEEMRMTEGVKIAVAYKTYPDGKITAKIRANHGYDIADSVAEHFEGGGHPYAAGFKTRNKSIDEITSEFASIAKQKLEVIDAETT